MGVNAYGVKSLESAGTNAVFALVDGSAGSTVLRIDTAGNLTEVVSSVGQVWMDMTVF